MHTHKHTTIIQQLIQQSYTDHTTIKHQNRSTIIQPIIQIILQQSDATRTHIAHTHHTQVIHTTYTNRPAHQQSYKNIQKSYTTHTTNHTTIIHRSCNNHTTSRTTIIQQIIHTIIQRAYTNHRQTNTTNHTKVIHNSYTNHTTNQNHTTTYLQITQNLTIVQRIIQIIIQQSHNTS